MENQFYEKHTKIISIAEFEKEIPPEKYPYYFSKNEIERYAHKKNKGSLAVRYALKTLIKEIFALKTPITAIEILNDKNNAPMLNLYNTQINSEIHISLSHAQKMAIVFLVKNKNVTI